MRKLVINAVIFVLAALPGPAETSRSDTLTPHSFLQPPIASHIQAAAIKLKSHSSSQREPGRPRKPELEQIGEVGVASWYGDEFNGRPTANGEVFDKDRLSAAHPSLPLGTWVKVTNLSNRRSLVLRINDRGPFVDGRVLDLSEAAARRLGFFAAGVAYVDIQVVKKLECLSSCRGNSTISPSR